MIEFIMALEHIRNHRFEPDIIDDPLLGRNIGTAGRTVCERHCDKCNKWVECDGVIGGLKFIAEHDSGDCSSA